MKILFLTIGQIQSLDEKSVHIDLINALSTAGHNVSVLCTREKRLNLPTEFVVEANVEILRLKIGNLTKCSIIEKGINTVLIEGQFVRALKKYFAKSEFDLVIYNTPPITLANVVNHCKKTYKCKSYLILKDIFPQNAVDINIMKTSGIMGMLYKLFRKKEKKLYCYSDKIGCMSEANIEYVLHHNKEVSRDKMEVFPNAVLSCDIAAVTVKNKALLEDKGIDTCKLTFIYGGNLGKPQGLDFLVEGIKTCADLDCNFVVVGSGQEKKKVFSALENVANAYTFDYLPYEEYKAFCASCDVGIIMLDHRFTIPNYPSRVLSYMENSMPVFACTDGVTDIKELVLEQAKCGRWCLSSDILQFADEVKWFIQNKNELETLGENGRKYMETHFNTDICVAKLEEFCADALQND